MQLAPGRCGSPYSPARCLQSNGADVHKAPVKPAASIFLPWPSSPSMRQPPRKQQTEKHQRGSVDSLAVSTILSS